MQIHYRCVAGAMLAWSLVAVGLAAEDAVSFRANVAPILLDHCQACHGAKKAEGGYRVDTFEELQKAGDSGMTPIVAQKPDESELLRRIACEEAWERMPAEAPALSAEQIGLVQKWISEGAAFDGEDAKQRLSLVVPPATFADPPQTYRFPVPITASVFTQDGSQLVVGGYHELLVWDVSSQQLIRRIPNVGERVTALAWAPDQKTLAVACGQPGRSGEVRLVDYESGHMKGVVSRVDDVVLDVAFRPGTNLIAAACTDGAIRICDVEQQTTLTTVSSHADWVTAVAWSQDGQWLASASRDKSVKVYRAEDTQLVASYLGHPAAVSGVQFLPDGKHVLSAAGNEVHRWEAESAKKVKAIGIGRTAGKLLRDQQAVFVACQDGQIVELNAQDDTVVRNLTGHAAWVVSLALHPVSSDRPLLATGAMDGELRIWNAGSGEGLQQWVAKP